MKFLSCLFAWLMLCTAAPAHAADPVTILASYDIYKAGIRIGLIEETYRRDQDHYSLTSSTRAVGLFSLFKPGKIVVSSSGLIDAQGLKPLAFSAFHDDNQVDERRAVLDWNVKKLTLIHRDERKELALPDGTQDRLSAMYQFMFLPLQSPMLDFQMINGGYLLEFHFAVSKGETLQTPAGAFSTLYLDNRAQAAKERTEIWLATQHHNLPCKMIITDADGGKITQLLRTLDVKP